MSIPPTASPTLTLLILSMIRGLGPATIKALLSTASHDRIPAMTPGQLSAVPGIGPALSESIHRTFNEPGSSRKATTEAEAIVEKLERLGAGIVTIVDTSYPPLLKELYDPPPCLFVRGSIQALSTPSLAVVGTREVSTYGRKATESLCSGLVSRGMTIVSGLAFGVDTVAHTTAIEHGGTTVAVLAGGVDNPYTDPRGKLWPRIIEHGALVSEEPPETAIRPGNFPKRNRLISGLCYGTLVVESDTRGGSLITAAEALEQNREVFAVPGPIFSRTSRGTNKLIERGHARLVTSPDSILQELPEFLRKPEPGSTNDLHHKRPHLARDEQQLLDLLDDTPRHIDELASRAGSAPADLLIRLFDLEMKNLVEQLPGQLFQKTVS
ncbi:DNA-protecting protein DprA [Prosthecochloris sp. N3]|uniref:DNA-protecting protein DprA n=1 Tax=Prosthecochloris ethylica TaxID=2743976 RepID=A0ABR9XRY0_9CHLB|nr:DNA-processing protein DprA [Prosthecochloris ethylica]MBF0586845.1 DNA-protecting protein DprA [Prosthecochloris ethylica]MBF0636807.1 DNA-protecting protein DprA [Prosthecochloris ethylica]NUK48023.1 DNA-protecting protein DprA [Prosthecochloris ethylica]